MRSVHVHWFAVELKDKERKINSGKKTDFNFAQEERRRKRRLA